MTATTLPSGAVVTRPASSRRLIQQLSDIAVLTGRNLVHIAREPLRLSDVTIQPILFTLLFVYVIGAGVALPHGGSYTPACSRSTSPPRRSGPQSGSAMTWAAA